MSSPAKSIAVTNVLLASACLIAGCSRDTGKPWAPSEHPDPQAILDEAKADAVAKHYENALVKQIWFHENALKIRPSLYGVRLSFALGYWVELGKSYPPALEKLKSIRDDGGKRIREGQSTRDLFNDFESINKYLEEDDKTKDVFVWLDSNNPGFAKSVFDIAKPSLIKAKAYGLCGAYLNPDASFTRILNLYRHHRQLAKGPKFGNDLLEFGQHSFSNEAATLVALLAVNGRTEEANRIATEATAEWNDPDFKTLLEKAKHGEVPAPWP